MTVRSDIIAAVQSVLQGVPSLNAVGVGRIDPSTLSDYTLPAAFVIPSGDRRSESQSTGLEVYEWDLAVDVWCHVASAEAIFGAVHAAMAADPSLGGVAVDCNRVGSEIHDTDTARDLSAFTMMFQIKYRHPFGSP